MSEDSEPYGDHPRKSPYTCSFCEHAAPYTHRAFSRQRHQVEYTRDGDTPNDMAHLTILEGEILSRYCAKLCETLGLAYDLSELGLPSHIVNSRVEAGPVCPCIRCGKPVLLTHPHTAWVRAEIEMVQQEGENRASPNWFDVMAVECDACGATLHQRLALAVQLPLEPLTPIEEGA